MITVNTKLIALLGTPLGHSLSPKMQNYVYKKLGIDAYYFPVECDNEHIGDIINAIRYMNFCGFAVTTPNKEFAVQFMDELDDLARVMGAINTVVKTGTHLKGYNTDGEGAVKALKDDGVDIQNSTFFAWGAGGAGKAVIFTLAHKGAKKIYVCDFPEKSDPFVESLNKNFPKTEAIAVHIGEDEKIAADVTEADILMNLSGLGMSGKENLTPVDPAIVQPRHVCFDATYKPEKTLFLKNAESKGCRIINGMGMVVNQGALQAHLWTGCEPPYAEMKEGILSI